MQIYADGRFVQFANLCCLQICPFGRFVLLDICSWQICVWYIFMVCRFFSWQICAISRFVQLLDWCGWQVGAVGIFLWNKDLRGWKIYAVNRIVQNCRKEIYAVGRFLLLVDFCCSIQINFQNSKSPLGP